MTLEEANEDVTLKVFAAEAALDAAIAAWKALELAENVIASHEDADEGERILAAHGAGMAHVTLVTLEALRGRQPSPQLIVGSPSM